MLRRVQWAPIILAVSFCAWGFIAGCEATGADLGNPLPVAQGGSNSSATGGVSSSNGGNSYQPQGGQTATGQGGGSTSTNTGQGGATGNGGNTSTGGSTSTSSSNTGGATTSATGGAKPTGGSTSTGNGGSTTSATGGATTTSATGGATTTTTSTGVGGATVGPTGNTVTFTSGKASGAMLGYGFVALGSADALTDPTCGTGKTTITNAAPCATSTNWTGTGLCMTGSIPALPAAPVAADYSSNWGVSVGVNATEPAGSGLGQSFASITITVAGTPTAGLRAQVHKKGEADSVNYCVNNFTSGTAMPFTSFVTDCYNGTPAGTKITPADVPSIDKISVQVSSGSTAITVTNLCITGISFS